MDNVILRPLGANYQYVVLYMFLRCHFEAILHCVAIFSHFTIHLRGKTLCIFIDFDVFANQKKVMIFALGRCV